MPSALLARARLVWSQVLFPDANPIDASSASRAAPLLLLLLVAGLLFYTGLGSPLLEPDEARYAEISRQMLVEGRWLVPVLHGQVYVQKPPLLYWLVMISYQAFGVADWTARLVPCSASLLTVLLTYLWGRQVAGPRAGFAGGLMLALSARFVYLGRMLTMDSLLCLWVTAALMSAHLAIRSRALRWHWWCLAAGACGLGLLTKGPVALVLVAVPVLALQTMDPRTARPRRGPWLAFLAVAVGLACPWYVAIGLCSPDGAWDFFWVHNVLRYVAPIDHHKPAWFYLRELLPGMLPWTLLLALLAYRRNRRPAMGFFLLACLWCLLFFSAAGCKRPGYILPAMPPLTLALGCGLDAILVRQPCPARQGWLLRRPWTAGWGMVSVTTFVILWLGVYSFLPGHARQYSLRQQVRPLLPLAANPQMPVLCYPHRWDSVSFYLHRGDVQVYAETQRQQLMADLLARPQTLVFIKTGDGDRSPLNDLLGALPACLEFVPYAPPGIATAGLIRKKS